MGPPMIQCCVNGPRRPSEHPGLPVSAEAIAAAARAVVEAGATDLHVHPKTADGKDTLEPDVVAAVVQAVRDAVPGVPVGVTTGAWAEADPLRRVELVRAWVVLPDHASVNWHETGADIVAKALLDRGIGVEAGLWSGTTGVECLMRSGLAPLMLRFLAEVVDPDPVGAVAEAELLLGGLEASLPLDRVPVLLHGEDGGAWPVLRMALARGLDIRIGLEDTLVGLDGAPATDNAELVRQAEDLV